MDGQGHSLLQHGQAEIARQLNQLTERVGTFGAQLADRVTHRELMQEFGGFRKEFTGKLDHMEVKFDQAAEKVDTSLEKAIDRIQDKLASTAVKAVAEAMAVRETNETKAREAVKRSEDEVQRQIRSANRTGAFGVGTGLLGMVAFIAERMGAFG
jgi:hypothetical protein